MAIISLLIIVVILVRTHRMISCTADLAPQKRSCMINPNHMNTTNQEMIKQKWIILSQPKIKTTQLRCPPRPCPSKIKTTQSRCHPRHALYTSTKLHTYFYYFLKFQATKHSTNSYIVMQCSITNLKS